MRIQGQAFGDCQVMASSLGLSHHDVHLCREYSLGDLYNQWLEFTGDWDRSLNLINSTMLLCCSVMRKAATRRRMFPQQCGCFKGALFSHQDRLHEKDHVN